MKRSVVISLLVAAVLSFGFSTVYAAVQPAAIEYYVPNERSSEVVVSVTDTNGKQYRFNVDARFHDELIKSIAARLGVSYEAVNLVARKVEPPSVLDSVIYYGKWAVGAIAVLVFFFSNAFIVRERSAVVIERLGKFNRVAVRGLKFKWPFIESRVKTVSLRTEQSPVTVETATKDGTFVKIIVSVMHTVTDVEKSYYELADPDEQMKSWIFDVVRSKVPEMDLVHVFNRKDDIAHAVKDMLGPKMEQYGIRIDDAPVTHLDPEDKVKAAMNEMVTQDRLRQAAEMKGEAARILVVKAAMGESESKKLQGEGIANQRKAIIQGFKESVALFREAAGSDAMPEEKIMQFVLITQYFDTLGKFAEHGNSNLISLPHSPSGLSDMFEQMAAAMASGKALSAGPKEKA